MAAREPTAPRAAPDAPRAAPDAPRAAPDAPRAAPDALPAVSDRGSPSADAGGRPPAGPDRGSPGAPSADAGGRPPAGPDRDSPGAPSAGAGGHPPAGPDRGSSGAPPGVGGRASSGAADALAFARCGRGPVLVLLHALGADRRMWDPVLARVAEERDVIALDMPGFGGSPPISPAAPVDLARAVAAQLEALGVERPHVAGSSLGGWVALELGLLGVVRSVTAIAPAGLWPQPLLPRRSRARALARALRPVLPLVVRSERGRRAALSGSIAHPERVPPRAALELVRAYADAPGFDAANAGMRAGRFTGMGRIHVPITLVWPDRDRLVARPRALPPGVREVVLRDCGHLPTWDDPAQVAAALLHGSA